MPGAHKWSILYSTISQTCTGQQEGEARNLQVAGALMRPPPKEIKPTVQVTPNVNNKSMENNENVSNEDSPLLSVPKKPKTSKLKLLKNFSFVLYLLNLTTCMFPSTLTFLPSYGLEIGISTATSSLLISANGLSDIVGRLGSGLFFDRVMHGRKRVYHSIIGICAGISVILVGTATGAISLLIITIFHGFVEGIFSAQRTVVPFEFVDAEDMSDAIGLMIFTECIGAITGPVAQGVIKAKYGSYMLGFFIGGAMFAASSCVMFADYIVRTLIVNFTY